MESFFSTLKIERVNRRGLYKSRKEAKADVFNYIECFYNPKRRHSTIGYVSPANSICLSPCLRDRVQPIASKPSKVLFICIVYRRVSPGIDR